MMVFLCLFLITGVSFYKAFSVATAYILQSKNRLAAIQVANEKMEIIRSLEYTKIGTKKSDGAGGWTYGIPAGDILEYETVTKNTRTFYVHITVMYKDDALDGTAAAHTDTRPADYKEVRTQVSWDPNYIESKSAYLVSRFVPPGMEAIATGGILSVNVQNNLGVPTPGASVRLYNLNTHIDQIYDTDSGGNVMFLEVPQDLNPNYIIIVSGDDLFSVHTYPAYSVSIPGTFDPADKNMTITNGALWPAVITTDKKATLKIHTDDLFGNPISGVEFNLEGGRKMGDENPTVNPLVPIYSYKQTGLISDSEGNRDITDATGLSSGTYNFTPVNFPSKYEFVKMGNSTSILTNFYLQPGANLDETALFADKDASSVLLTIMNSADSTPLSEASVNLKNTTLGYDSTVTTDYSGKAFFSNGSDPLTAGDYDIAVTLSGYQTKNDSINISSSLEKKDIALDAS